MPNDLFGSMRRRERVSFQIVRGHPYKALEKHGFIASQKEGMEVFRHVDPAAPIITCAEGRKRKSVM